MPEEIQRNMRNLSWDEKLFLFLLVLFLATGILGLYGPAYWERSGDRYMFSQYWVVQLIFMVVAGVAIFHYMPRILLRFWQSLNSWRKIVLFVGVVFLIFIITMGVFKFINVSVGRVKIPVKGYVYRKWKVRHRKSTDYFLIVRDTASIKQYEFEVKRQVYDLTGNPGDAYSNTFYKGCFGVVYRHNIW